MWPAPDPGDIVWCRFPERPRDRPGPKPRPALVLIVTEHEDGIAVSVAYGTSQKLDRLVVGEFLLRKADNAAAFQLAGLSHDTKFDLGKTVELPWNETFFAVAPEARFGQTPKLGSLHASMMKAVAGAARAARRSG